MRLSEAMRSRIVELYEQGLRPKAIARCIEQQHDKPPSRVTIYAAIRYSRWKSTGSIRYKDRSCKTLESSDLAVLSQTLDPDKLLSLRSLVKAGAADLSLTRAWYAKLGLMTSAIQMDESNQNDVADDFEFIPTSAADTDTNSSSQTDIAAPCDEDKTPSDTPEHQNPQDNRPSPPKRSFRSFRKGTHPIWTANGGPMSWTLDRAYVICSFRRDDESVCDWRIEAKKSPKSKGSMSTTNLMWHMRRHAKDSPVNYAVFAQAMVNYRNVIERTRIAYEKLEQMAQKRRELGLTASLDPKEPKKAAQAKPKLPQNSQPSPGDYSKSTFGQESQELVGNEEQRQEPKPKSNKIKQNQASQRFEERESAEISIPQEPSVEDGEEWQSFEVETDQYTSFADMDTDNILGSDRSPIDNEPSVRNTRTEGANDRDNILGSDLSPIDNEPSDRDSHSASLSSQMQASERLTSPTPNAILLEKSRITESEVSVLTSATMQCPHCLALLKASDFPSHQERLHTGPSHRGCGHCPFQSPRLTDALAHALLHGHALGSRTSEREMRPHEQSPEIMPQSPRKQDSFGPVIEDGYMTTCFKEHYIDPTIDDSDAHRVIGDTEPIKVTEYTSTRISDKTGSLYAETLGKKANKQRKVVNSKKRPETAKINFPVDSLKHKKFTGYNDVEEAKVRSQVGELISNKAFRLDKKARSQEIMEAN